MKYASVWQRLLAHFIDCLAFLAVGLWFLLGVAQSSSLEQSLTALLSWLIYLIWSWLVYTLLQTVLVTKFGGSLGKLVTGIAIKDSAGKNISFAKALFRETIAKTLSTCLLGLGFWWLLKDKNRQSWHDMASDTFVTVVKPLNTVVGVVALGVLLGSNVLLAKQIVNSAVANKGMYEEFVNDAVMSFREDLIESYMRENMDLESASPSPTLRYQYNNLN